MHAAAIAAEPVLSRQSFMDATARVNEWRGRCLDAFTRGEAAVTECLIAMAAVGDGSARVELPHLVGQRLEALSTALGPDGPFVRVRDEIAPTLDQFRQHSDLRNMLCHGVAKVTLDALGHWTVVLRLTTLTSRKECRKIMVLTQIEADELQGRVVRASKALCARLEKVRAGLT